MEKKIFKTVNDFVAAVKLIMKDFSIISGDALQNLVLPPTYIRRDLVIVGSVGSFAVSFLKIGDYLCTPYS